MTDMLVLARYLGREAACESWSKYARARSRSAGHCKMRRALDLTTAAGGRAAQATAVALRSVNCSRLTLGGGVW